AVIAVDQGKGVISNDDALPSVSIADVNHSEGNAGPNQFEFTVSLSNPSSQTITVDYQTEDATATVADSDYVFGGGTLVFGPGELSKTIVVTVNGDVHAEADETFFVNLGNLIIAQFADDRAVGTILNDDTMPGLKIDDVKHYEGNNGTTSFTFTVSLSV